MDSYFFIFGENVNLITVFICNFLIDSGQSLWKRACFEETIIIKDDQTAGDPCLIIQTKAFGSCHYT